MSAPVCPACGVAVVPGYVRCPKCHKPLPRRPAAIEGGTALEQKSRAPAIVAIAAAVLVGGGSIAYFILRGDDVTTEAPPPVVTPEVEDTDEQEVVTTPDLPAEPTSAPKRPDAQATAAELERSLKRQRLWSTVTVVGGRVDVRSGSCDDPAMAPELDGATPALKAAGLTKLRCVEQSGRVVSERDL